MRSISPAELPDVFLKYVGKQGYTVNNVGMSIAVTGREIVKS